LTLTDSALLNGVWDMTANDKDPAAPKLFVSNVLTGTVVRIVVHVHHKNKPMVDVESITKIGSGFTFRTDPAALVIGPTGLAWDEETDELFVADTGANRIAELDHVSSANGDQGKGDTVKSGPPLFGPLGLVLTPRERHLVLVNGDAVGNPSPDQFNLAVELTRHGEVVATRQLDNTGTAGALFGITLTEFQHELSLVFVDDNSNSVNIQKTR
jgi:sugar lactone lactonase YvrE